MADLIDRQKAIDAIKQIRVHEQKQEEISLAVALARVRESEFMPAHDKVIRKEARLSGVNDTCKCIQQIFEELKPPYTKKAMRYVLKTAVQMLNEKADVGSE